MSFCPISERLEQHHWLHHHRASILYHHRETCACEKNFQTLFRSRKLEIVKLMFCIVGDAENVDVDCGRVNGEEFLHHYGNVPADAVLRLCRGDTLWLRQIRRESWKVSTRCSEFPSYQNVKHSMLMSSTHLRAHLFSGTRTSEQRRTQLFCCSVL